jgi:hypothetical protein
VPVVISPMRLPYVDQTDPWQRIWPGRAVGVAILVIEFLGRVPSPEFNDVSGSGL